MIKKYRKKPVVVEAVQLNWDNFTGEVMPWCKGVFWHDKIAVTENNPAGQCMCIDTLEGGMIALVGDYIIKGVNGEFYPCKADIFAKTYESEETEI